MVVLLLCMQAHRLTPPAQLLLVATMSTISRQASMVSSLLSVVVVAQVNAVLLLSLTQSNRLIALDVRP